ncbi:MAG: hypothetical protein KME60_09715 [Cyanomargarita calcarea GSE-NOS-MK-12-04C]|jgi:hypothetical protein|uniref:Uncharacterized protein n=1 Tax=Cyanomargarita calcarea GSE-NOS-MK-12-04C TaxID=2839659 RepID=A0A951UUC8_9CYAN|nr:hypothetical protein [Cyanomargarita calcarea GSE-NOS-MK-12-04C]
MARQKLNRASLHARVDSQTSEALKRIAYKLGYIYDTEGSIGQLLDAIASQEQVLMPQCLYFKAVDALTEMRDNIKCGEENQPPMTKANRKVTKSRNP